MNCTYIKYIIKLCNDLIQSIFIYLANIRISRKVQIYRQCIVLLFSGNRWQIYFLLNLTKNINDTRKKKKNRKPQTHFLNQKRRCISNIEDINFFSYLFFFFLAFFIPFFSPPTSVLVFYHLMAVMGLELP